MTVLLEDSKVERFMDRSLTGLGLVYHFDIILFVFKAVNQNNVKSRVLFLRGIF